MPLVIDAYNVIQTVGALPPELAGVDVDGLMDLIRASRYHRHAAHLVCDGRPGPRSPRGRFGGMTIHYSGDQSADDVIATMIRAMASPRTVTVVSSDNGVKRAAKRRGCRAMSSSAFLRQLAADVRRSRPAAAARTAKPTGALSPESIERWKAIFCMSDGDLGRLEQETSQRPLPARKRPSKAAASELGRAEDPRSTTPPKSKPHEGRSAEPKPVLPPDILEQAERMWDDEERRRRSRSTGRPLR